MSIKPVIILLSLGAISFLQVYSNNRTTSAYSEDFNCDYPTVLNDRKCTNLDSQNEINALSQSYWSEHLCQVNDSFYVLRDETLYELKNVELKGVTYKLTPADKLNHIQVRGNLFIDTLVSRYYTNDTGWTKWSDYRPYLSVNVEKINGSWQIEKQDRFVSPSCNNLPL